MMTGRLLWFLATAVLAACGQADGQGNTPVPAENLSSAPVAVAAVPASERVSRFTQLDGSACGPEKIIEETGDWDRRCEGAGGYALEWGSGDLREDLAVLRAGKSTDLEIPSKVAGGAFDALGKTVEWRGPVGAAPDVLVVRVHVANAEGKNDSGRLAIARLGNSPCVVAVVPVGAGQSDRARAIVDGKLPDCLAAD